jgi:hypothetical protein
LPYEIQQITDSVLSSKRFAYMCTHSFVQSVREFIQKEFVEKLILLRKSYGLEISDKPPEDHRILTNRVIDRMYGVNE